MTSALRNEAFERARKKEETTKWKRALYESARCRGVNFKILTELRDILVLESADINSSKDLLELEPEDG